MGHRLSSREHAFFITCVIIRHLPILKHQVFRNYLIDSLRYAVQKQHWYLQAYVIMSNHWHAIVAARDRTIGETIKGIKGTTNRKIIIDLNTNQIISEKASRLLDVFKKHNQRNYGRSGYQVWENGYYPTYLETQEIWNQKLNYIHFNPVKAGIVKDAEEYPYSSACLTNPLQDVLI
jgi:putative transposase